MPAQRTRHPTLATALVFAIAATGCSGCFADAGGGAGSGALSAPVVAAAATAPSRLSQSLPDFAGLVDQYGGAVVNVSVVGQRGGGSGEVPEAFEEFFRRFGQPMPRGNVPPARGEGSGFIVSSDGYVLTNAHVVARAEEVTVKTNDRREYRAEVVGVDEATDVAVLKIDARGLPTVRIGDPSSLRPGQWVVAIGSPFGFENSVTAGIVSATARSMPGSNYVPFIQTDVAVNPGNSGGPLFNLNGEVVGINSQIYSSTGSFAGLSFAIPIDVANSVREQLVSNGKVTRSRIAVGIQDVNAQLAESFGLDRPRGALVGMVEPDGPGAKAGILPGDVILKVDNVEVDRSSELPVLIAAMKPGTRLSLEVWRDGKPRRINVTTVEIEDKDGQVASRSGSNSKNEETAKLGLSVRELTREEKSSTTTEGTLVVQNAEGPAAAAGVRRGDIILGVNGKAVKSVDELRKITRETKGKVVALLIQRGESQIFLPVQIS